MSLWWWRKKSVKQDVPQPSPPPRPRPAAKIKVFIYLHGKGWGKWELDYDQDLPHSELFGVEEGEWLCWPVDRDGFHLRVRKEDIESVLIRPPSPRND